MKIVSAQQIKNADAYTIKNEPITSLNLMERAAERLTERITAFFPSKEISFSIFCGIGNNGGDGLVVYRLLEKLDYKVNCYIIDFSEKRSEDFLSNLEKLKNLGLPIHEIQHWKSEELSLNEVIIDAVLGVGIDRPAKGLIADYIHFFNKEAHFTISVDVPTGMYSDQSNQLEDAIFKADLVFTFELPKLGLFLPPNENYIGALEVLSIGLSEEFIKSIKSPYILLTDELIRKFKKEIKKGSHKGTFGHLGVIAGQRGMMGAAVLSAQGAMRSGLGKCTVFSPSIGRDIIQIKCPEVLVNDQYGKDFIQICPDNLKDYDALVLGPGLGVNKETENAVKEMLQQDLPNMVIDADALNIIAKNEWLNQLKENTIITPHPGEFERLFGKTENRLEAIRKQQEYAQKHRIIIVLKGHHTTICLPSGEVFINNTGNPGMATAGVGDVLTGIIGSLLAQSYNPKEAALLGVYIHGLSGDLAAENQAHESIIASDIVANLGEGFLI
jgi:NAD(P)H-hydrate epimerase